MFISISALPLLMITQVQYKRTTFTHLFVSLTQIVFHWECHITSISSYSLVATSLILALILALLDPPLYYQSQVFRASYISTLQSILYTVTKFIFLLTDFSCLTFWISHSTNSKSSAWFTYLFKYSSSPTVLNLFTTLSHDNHQITYEIYAYAKHQPYSLDH